MADSAVYVGLISGTSADAIDAAVVRIDADRIETLATRSHPFPATLAASIASALAAPDALTARDSGRLDAALGDAFADAALAAVGDAGLTPADVAAVGSHGQTLYHEPDGEHPFTLQLGDPARIAARTGVTTVADFRRADVAAGGQGAPLAPLLHAALFADGRETRAVVNLGGIANVTLLAPGHAVSGFDTGPANTLMDRWAALTGHGSHDTDGRLAAAGTVDDALLARLLDEPYFSRPAPKSTGREYFDTRWLLDRLELTPEAAARLKSQDIADIMATLCELTARTVAKPIRDAASASGGRPARVIVCGGGWRNPQLLHRLGTACGGPVETTADHGVDPDFVEAVLFAWLAAHRIAGRSVDTRTITGARRPVYAGSVHEPTPE